MAKLTIKQLITHLKSFDADFEIEFDYIIDADSKTVSELFGEKKRIAKFTINKLIEQAKAQPGYYGLVETSLTYVFSFDNIESANNFAKLTRKITMGVYELKDYVIQKSSRKLFDVILFKAKK